MPMIPQDMEKCHARTLKDQAEMRANKRATRERQKQLKATHDRILRELEEKYGAEGIVLFLD